MLILEKTDCDISWLLEDGHISIDNGHYKFGLFFLSKVILQTEISNVIDVINNKINDHFNCCNFVKTNPNEKDNILISFEDSLALAIYFDMFLKNNYGIKNLSKFNPLILLDYPKTKYEYLGKLELISYVENEKEYIKQIKNKFKPDNKTYLEKEVVDNLIKTEKLKAVKEQVTLFGRIDILTDTQLIEVKEFSGYKSAIGQLIAYSKHYPKHRPRLHLFGKTNRELLPSIKLLCNEFNIKLTLEDN